MVSAAAGVMQGLGGAVRARGLIGGSFCLDRGTTLGFCVPGLINRMGNT